MGEVVIAALFLGVLLIMLFPLWLIPGLALLDTWVSYKRMSPPLYPQPQQPQQPTVIVLGQPQSPQQQQAAPIHNHYYLSVQTQPSAPQALPQPVQQPPIIVIDGADEVRRLRQALPAPGLPRPRGE